MIGFDPLYFVILAPAILFAMFASFRVKMAFNKGQKIQSISHVTGAEAARKILDSNGLHDVQIERIQDTLGDHYDPRAKVLRLSPEVYDNTALSSLGVAAHEAGHAIQDAKSYPFLKIRNAVVPVASFGSNASMILLLIGAVLSSAGLIKLGVIAYTAVVVFQIINLPVEFDASRRAKEILFSQGIIYDNERATISSVLNAAAMTYVAATVSAILTLLYYLIRLGAFGSRDNE